MKTRKDKKKKEMEYKKNVLQLHVQLVLKKKSKIYQSLCWIN